VSLLDKIKDKFQQINNLFKMKLNIRIKETNNLQHLCNSKYINFSLLVVSREGRGNLGGQKAMAVLKSE
jgi:hypothetical protein